MKIKENTMEFLIDDCFGNEIELEIIGTYEPAEDMTWDYPGSPEEYIIEEVYVVGTNSEVCLLPSAELEAVDHCLNEIHDEFYYDECGEY
jgi:hypothetical protein